MSEYEKGDLLKMTARAIESGLVGRAKSHFGIFVRYTRDGHLVVIRDGIKTPEYYHKAFWRRAGEAQ